MIRELPDVDIDLADRNAGLAALTGLVQASQLNQTGTDLARHASGIYLEKIPVDPISGLAAFPYDDAETLGYHKIDLLTNTVYAGLEHEDHLLDLLDQPIQWEWFLDPEFNRSLFHFGGHVDRSLTMGDVVSWYEPGSVTDLAILVALKMPGKKHLIGLDWYEIKEKIWIREDRGIQFKKSHSIAYGMVVGIDARRKAPDYYSKIQVRRYGD